ncbi:dihydroorotase [Lunatibacter salilacus]|uniref:dihydroorotase n=1 Tax=Lunatibacter salilacus TaxID=2483804 RepID=UPI00131E76E8|nr:dihydroorotase [Lunatibacter salilacus]
MGTVFQSLQLITSDKTSEPADYLYDGQKIEKISANSNDTSHDYLDCSGLLGSSGWIDLRCFAGEPGMEYRETLESLCQTLAYGGFAQAVILPNTKPALQSKNEIAFVQQRARQFFPTLHIQAAITKDILGEDFTEMLDLHDQGIRIFGEGTNPLSHSDRMTKALQYLQKFDGILFDQAYDPMLALYGQMHEGYSSTLLGLKGIPTLAEEVAIQKNLAILRYSGGNLHFQTLSTAEGVRLIRQAKADGLQVTSDVSLYQLLFLDEDLSDFNTALKVMPPFRTREDREALVEGLTDGTIDAIVSNHIPHDFDSKHMEFDLAPFGMAGIQTFAAGLSLLEKELGWPLLIDKITKGPARVIKMEEGEMRSLTVFDPKAIWKFDAASNPSLSQNSPWFNAEVAGKVRYVVNGQKMVKIDE